MKNLRRNINNETKSAETHDILCVHNHNSITQINQKEWDDLLGGRGIFDWNGLFLLERAFKNNPIQSGNWAWQYLTIKDLHDEIVLMTFYISAHYKLCISSRASISMALENDTIINPKYQGSQGISVGSPFAEGNQVYINHNHSEWRKAMQILFDSLNQFQEQEEATNIMFRDLEFECMEFDELMIKNGFVKIDLPESSIVDDLLWKDEDDFMDRLPAACKEKFIKHIQKLEHLCDVEFRDHLNPEELQHAMNLYNVANEKNLIANSFPFPDKVFREMVYDPNWEFVVIKVKHVFQLESTEDPIVVCFCHKNIHKVYSLMISAIDYDYVYQYSGYRAAMWAVVKRAKELGCRRLNFGTSATVEKKRVGARPYQRVGYFQANDNYALETMEETIAKRA